MAVAVKRPTYLTTKYNNIIIEGFQNIYLFQFVQANNAEPGETLCFVAFSSGISLSAFRVFQSLNGLV